MQRREDVVPRLPGARLQGRILVELYVRPLCLHGLPQISRAIAEHRHVLSLVSFIWDGIGSVRVGIGIVVALQFLLVRQRTQQGRYPSLSLFDHDDHYCLKNLILTLIPILDLIVDGLILVVLIDVIVLIIHILLFVLSLSRSILSTEDSINNDTGNLRENILLQY